MTVIRVLSPTGIDTGALNVPSHSRSTSLTAASL